MQIVIIQNINVCCKFLEAAFLLTDTHLSKYLPKNVKKYPCVKWSGRLLELLVDPLKVMRLNRAEYKDHSKTK